MRSHTETQDFHFDFHSTIDPHAIKPALETEKQKKGIEYFEFDRTPFIEGQIWGRWRERELTGFSGIRGGDELSLSGATGRQPDSGIDAINGVLHATNAVLRRPEGSAILEALGFDVGTKRLYLTNAVGRLNPVAVTTAIGPENRPGI